MPDVWPARSMLAPLIALTPLPPRTVGSELGDPWHVLSLPFAKFHVPFRRREPVTAVAVLLADARFNTRVPVPFFRRDRFKVPWRVAGEAPSAYQLLLLAQSNQVAELRPAPLKELKWNDPPLPVRNWKA